MTYGLVFEQLLNGLQSGVMLFLMAAGLTLVLGIMNVVNLAHGSLYMVGAYLALAVARWTGSYLLGFGLGIGGALIVGMLVELVVLRALYERDHLDQVLATFGLILFFNELIAILWGRAALFASPPAWLRGHIDLFTGSRYPSYRMAIIAVGLVTAFLLWYVVTRTRLGMLIRAGASNRRMIAALGVNIELLFSLVFGLGAVFAGLAGLMAAPISSVKIGMGDDILILALVIIVIGGIGSIKGAFVAAMIVGQIDIVGRAFLPDLLKSFLSPASASAAAPAISQVLIYVLMAGVLVWRPTGLFGQRL
jgi:branched-chain amino acid transport system permease protein